MNCCQEQLGPFQGYCGGAPCPRSTLYSCPVHGEEFSCIPPDPEAEVYDEEGNCVMGCGGQYPPQPDDNMMVPHPEPPSEMRVFPFRHPNISLG